MLKKASIISFVTVLLALAIWYGWSKGTLTSLVVLNPLNPGQLTPTPPIEGWKMYENTEFGFAFQYPKEWTVSEERDTNPYNKFKVAVTPQVYQYFQPFYVLVKNDTNRITSQFRALEASALEISVGGKQATRYEYDEEVHHTTIIIPISEERSLIIGNERNENVAEFEKILTSFRFLK